MSWGNKLLIVFVVFAGGMSYMVYRCMHVPVDLVAAEYYRDELAYQDVIDGRKQADALGSRVTLERKGDSVLLQMPGEMRHGALKGEVLFYCAADARRDRSVALAADPDGRQEIGLRGFVKGSYVVKIKWERAGIGYFTEAPFVIE